MTPKHGEERNYRTEKTEAQFSSHEYSVSERYCEKCKSWGEVRGLVSSNFCPTCEIPFDKSWWEDSEKSTH